MQLRKRGRNRRAINENLHQLNEPNYHSTDTSDSSDEYEEETHIKYRFRRWANHIWSVSSNVTSKLRDLLSSHPSSNTASDHSVEESCHDESNATSWATSSGFIESSNRINGTECNARDYHQHLSNYGRSTPRENYYCGYDQEFSQMMEDRRNHHVTANRLETHSNFIVGHGADVATYSPVLILPRLHQGVNRQFMDARSHQSRKHMSPRRNMHGDESADSWYQHCHHLGRRWNCEGFRMGDRHVIPEKLSSLNTDPKINGLQKKSTRTSRRGRKIEPCDHDPSPVKHLSSHKSDFHADERYVNDYDPIQPIRDIWRSREKTDLKYWTPKNYRNHDMHRKSNHRSESTVHTKVKNVNWDLQLPDIMSQEPSSTNPSMIALSAKSSVTLNIQKRRTIVDRNRKSNENIEMPVKDDAKHQEIIVPHFHDVNAVEQPQISHHILAAQKNGQNQNTDLMNGRDHIKWSSITENSVDLLLQSLRERMTTLANIHSPDIGITSGSTKCTKNEESSVAEECIVASCLGGTYLPQCSEGRDDMAVHSVVKNEEIRPSFCDRIQDIWQDRRARVGRDSSRHQTLPSTCDFKTEKDLPSKFSLLGLNQQPVLREYISEYNNAVTLAKILETLIDAKSKNDTTPSLISEQQKSPTKFNNKQSKTCLQVNVGVQNSTPISPSPSPSQDQTYLPRHRSTEKRRSRKSFRKNFKLGAPQYPIKAPRPLQVFSGQGIIPISSIQITPVVQPLPNFPRYCQSPLNTKSSSDCYSDPNGSHDHSVIIDNPVFQKGNPISAVDSGLKWSSLFSRHDSSSFTEELYSCAKDELLISRGVESSNKVEINGDVVNEHERVLSLVLEKIGHRQQHAEHLSQNTDVSQQPSRYHSTPVPYQESSVIDNRADTMPHGMSTKGRSWWKKKFHSDKNSNFKGRIASLFKYVSKKHVVDNKNSHLQNNALEIVRNENVVPIPPVRMRRKCNVGGTKSSKSIQWEWNETMSLSIKKIDLFQVTENQQSSKSTPVGPIVKEDTVTSCTDIILEESHKTSSRLSLIQKRDASKSLEMIKVPRQAYTDSLDTLLASDRKSTGSDIVIDTEEKSESLPTVDETTYNDSCLPLQENCKLPIISCPNERSHTCKSKKFIHSRSLLSKIPLAIKPVNHFNAATSSVISGERPSTVPALGRSSNHSLRSNEFPRNVQVGKSFDRECTNQVATKKTLVKHNRSSLLRANNSVIKKCTIGQFNQSRNTAEKRNIERTSILRSPMSSLQIKDKITAAKLFSVEETPCNKLDPEMQPVIISTENDTKAKAVLKNAKLNKHSKIHSTSSTSVCERKRTSTEKRPSCDVDRVSLLKITDLTHNEEIIVDVPIAASKQLPIDPKHSNDVRNLPEDSKSICEDLEHSDDKRLQPKVSEFPLNARIRSLNTNEEQKEAPIMNWKANKIRASKSVILGSKHLKEKDGSCETFSILCDSVSNEKVQKDDELIVRTRIEVNRDSNPKSLQFNDLKGIESKKSGLSNPNLSKQQLDSKNMFTESSVVKKQPESFLACRVKSTELQAPWDKKSKFQPQFTHPTTGDMEKRSLSKQANGTARKVPVQNKDTNRLKEMELKSKSIPNSGMLRQYGTAKNTVKNTESSCKHVMPFVETTTDFKREDNGSKSNILEISSIVDDSKSSEVKAPGAQNLDSELKSAHKTDDTMSRVAKIMKNSEQEITKVRETLDKKAEEELSDIVRRVIESAINESENVNLRKNLEMVHSRQNIHQSDPEKFSGPSIIDSLEPIRGPNVLGTPQSIGQNICPAKTDAVDERYSLFSCSLNQKKEFGNLCSQEQQSNICLKTPQLLPNFTSKPEIMSDITVNEGNSGHPIIQPSKKFLMAANPSPKNQTSGISTPSNIQSVKNSKDQGKLTTERSEIPFDLSEKTTHHDNEIEVTMISPRIGTNKNGEEVIPFEIEYHLTQSSITYDLVEIEATPEIFCPSMFDVHFESNLKFAKSKSQNSIGEKKFENSRFSNTESNSKMMNDESSGKSGRGTRNVKIDNKVLDEKVESGTENGIPLKEITIVVPAIIEYNYVDNCSSMTNEVIRDKDFEKTMLKVRENLSENFYDSQETRAAQDNSVLNTTRFELKDEPARHKSTLIPK